MTRQLSTLISASAPVEQAVQIVAAETDNAKLKRALLGVRTRVTEGRRLSSAMAEYPDIFANFYTILISAGEGSGSLGIVLERLADHLEKSRRLRAKVTTALVYPAALSLVAISVIVILMTFVVPKVVEQFDTLGQDLPAITRTMVAISSGMQTYGLLLLAAFGAAPLAFARAMKLAQFHRRVDSLVLRLPIIGRLTRALHAARLARTLATLVASGAPIVEGLAAARQATTNLVLRDVLADITNEVSEGEALSVALRRADAFPSLVGYMASVGESTGRLPEMLEKAADYLEAEYQSFTDTALTLLEPAIIVVMGIVVATIVLSILMPILQLNTLALI
jgi:general secretion pathway protein F